MHTLGQDIRYALRILAGTPAFTAAAVLCLALGIGLTTAVFSVANGVLLKPLPYRNPERLVRLYSEFPNFPNGGMRRFPVSPPEFRELQASLKNFDSLEAWVSGGASLNGGGAAEPFRATSCFLTGGLLESLGAAPTLGRLFTNADDTEGAAQTVIFSEGLWRRAYAADRNILGRQVMFNGTPATVIGVMPASFSFPPGEAEQAELWTPLRISTEDLSRRSSHFLYLLGSLKPGTSIAAARQEMRGYTQNAVGGMSGRTHNFAEPNHTLVAYGLHDEVTSGVSKAIWMLLGAVGFVLIIACVNVANLLLARAESRQREIAVRQAIGAGVPRLVRQFITEGAVLSLLGAIAGLALGWVSLRVLITAGANSIPRSAEVSLDPTVLLATVLISLATGVFFGLAPAWQIIGNLYDALKAAAGKSTAVAGSLRFRRFLVVVELALSLVLLIGSGLMVKAFWKLLEVHPGFNPDHLLTAQVSLTPQSYGDPGARNGFWNRFSAKLVSIPDVEGVALASGLAPQRRLNANDTVIEGFVQRPNGPIQNVDYWNTVSPGYFSTMGVRLIEGRAFEDRDNGPDAAKIIVINQTMARIHFPGQSALGRRIRPGARDPWFTIVGVVEDVKNAGLDKPAGTELYWCLGQVPVPSTMTLLLRTKGSPRSALTAIRAELNSLDASLPLARVRAMDEILALNQARPRFLTLLLAFFTFTAVTLAGIGIYGVVSFTVAKQTSEFGLRMALGAERGDILRAVMGKAMLLGVAGLVLGLAGAFALTRYLRDLLFGVSAFDAITFASMAAVLLAVTALACWLPARRATKVDPMVALRYE